MGKRINVDISDAQYKEILEQAKEEVKRELTKEAVKDYLNESRALPMMDMLRQFGLSRKVEELQERKVKDLMRNDKLTLMLYWIAYERFD